MGQIALFTLINPHQTANLHNVAPLSYVGLVNRVDKYLGEKETERWPCSFRENPVPPKGSAVAEPESTPEEVELRIREIERQAAEHFAEVEEAGRAGRLGELLADLPSIADQIAEAREASKRRA